MTALRLIADPRPRQAQRLAWSGVGLRTLRRLEVSGLIVRRDDQWAPTMAGLRALVPKHRHHPRRYPGPQPEGWRPGRPPYQAREPWREPSPLYTEEWYAWRDRLQATTPEHRSWVQTRAAAAQDTAGPPDPRHR